MVQVLMVLASVGLLGYATCLQVCSVIAGASLPIAGWGISWVVCVISFAAQAAAGSTAIQIIVPAAQLVATSVVLGWTLCADRKTQRKGVQLNNVDLVMIMCCMAGIVLWLISKDPYVAIWGNVICNFAGLVPQLSSTLRDFTQVNQFYWMLRGLSCLIAIGITPDHKAGLIPQFTGVIMAISMLVAWIIAEKLYEKSPIRRLRFALSQ